MNSHNEAMGMVDISAKYDTLRTATAIAIVRVNPKTISLIKRGKIPKGNIVDAARIAGLMAAKKTSDLIPYCHPIAIDSVTIEISIKTSTVEIISNVKSIWKTGVEMEALTAVSVASLTVYDMLKFADKSMSIESIKLLEKTGGSKHVMHHAPRRRVAILVASDTREKRDDLSGRKAVDTLSARGFDIVGYKIVEDDANIIAKELERFCDELKADFVITSGGTGIGPRDVTPEATKSVIDREVIGIAESMRSYGQKRNQNAMLSRGIAGIRGNTLIVNLPGSVQGVSESLEILLPGIIHGFDMIEGKKH